MNKYLGKPENYDPEQVKKLVYTKKISSIANLEKAIFALEYIAQLEKEGLDFVFKGGSAVQILLGDQWNRLSVDADICTNTSKQEVSQVIESVKNKFNDNGFSYTIRNSDVENKFVSYRVSTPPITNISRTILLDVQMLKPRYFLQSTQLKSFFYNSDITVQTPTINSILGDKLSVIGPTTIGRKLENSRNGIEYAKNFYDIHSLYNNMKNLKETKETYLSIIKIQEKVRDTKYELDQSIDDALLTCKTACLPQGLGEQLIRGSPIDRERASLEFEKLQDGLSRYRPFIVNEIPYTWDILREYSSTTALLLELVRSNCNNEKAVSILHSNVVESLGIEIMVNKIKKLEKNYHWFLDLEEIIAFPKILEKWYIILHLDELIK
jgi:hypothetical protein